MKAKNVWMLPGLVALVLAAGCLSTYQKRSAEGSGFLGDYSQFRKGGNGLPLLVWGDSNKTLRAYDKIMLDPVCMYATATNSRWARISEADRQKLVNYFDAALRRDLEPDFMLVDKPGPGVLRMRVAITEARGARVLLDTFSTVYPIGLAISAVRALATGVNSAVGTVGIEGEVLDSQTGQRLFAAVDARVGRKFTGKFDKLNKWRTAIDAFDYWADRLHGWLRMKHVQAEGRP